MNDPDESKNEQDSHLNDILHNSMVSSHERLD